MKPLADSLPQVPPKTNVPAPPSCEPRNAVALPLASSPEGSQLLATRLYRDFSALKTYGREPESLESIIDLFRETLADCSWEEINAAMTDHARESAEFPTPADILNRIRSTRRARYVPPERQLFEPAPAAARPTRERQAELLRDHAKALKAGV